MNLRRASAGTLHSGQQPALVEVNDIYADLGATITGPGDDLNLGIRIFVDGVATEPVALDTTTPGTHTVEYVVTGHFRVTNTSTRTAIISAPANDNPLPSGAELSSGEDNEPTASSTPSAANDNDPRDHNRRNTHLNNG